jgi:hypothetical protein
MSDQPVVNDSILELRQYTLRDGHRDALVELFDREFVEPQEAEGMAIIGQFRDLDRADRFVWLRGFTDMERRRAALEAFYTGPVWKANAAAANATMLEIDDVRLLRPMADSTRFAPRRSHPRPGESVPGSTIVATICSFDRPGPGPALDLPSALARRGVVPLGIFITEPSENTFPALPVREDEHAFVWFQRARRVDDETIGASLEVARSLPDLEADPIQLRLEPTPRSALR